MPAALLKLKNGMTAVLNAGLILAVALLVLDVVWGVFTRYVMGEQAKWAEDLARFVALDDFDDGSTRFAVLFGAKHVAKRRARSSGPWTKMGGLARLSRGDVGD